MGLAGAQSLLSTTSFYWDRTEESCKWRFFARRGVMPTQAQAWVYSPVCITSRPLRRRTRRDVTPG